MSLESLENRPVPGLRVPRRAKGAMWQGARVAQHGDYARNGSNEAGWVYTGWQPGTQNGNSGLAVSSEPGQTR